MKTTLWLLATGIALFACTKTKPPEATTALADTTTILQATNARPLTDKKFEKTEARLKRGEYLANGVLQCFVCHSKRDSTQTGFPPIASMKGGGAIIFEHDNIRMVAPNISPDKETGAGNWTDDMFARAIREGVGHDGRALSLPMYWESFSNLADEDVASVIVYLRSIPPVKNSLPGRSLPLEEEKQLQGSAKMLTGPVAFPDTADALKKGIYLVKVADCVGCHTGWYGTNPGMFGGGNPMYKNKNHKPVLSSNITPDPTGLAGWDAATFINAIRTGKGGTLDPSMPWISYRNVSDKDLAAILTALKRLPPVNHRVLNSLPATACVVCGQKHGYGEHNKVKPFPTVKTDTTLYAQYAGKYSNTSGFVLEVKYKDHQLLITEGGPDRLLVPIGNNRFNGLGLATPVSFERDKGGKVKTLISYWIEDEVFTKLP
jgi:mono/diheme cytochrome c family protein